ncbi:hypothetical protein L596_025947 [Steinernema carpocapsae]|uniref:Uncharacterized protein n=1 Tax=Steinernema carpocapsae TaxID=34508 RepID=A0A4U5M9B1_STECR|nr:hypothetical protein L596_025947 [Steinernema carpocapsae]
MLWCLILSTLIVGVLSNSLPHVSFEERSNKSYCTVFSEVHNTLFAGQLNALGFDIRDVVPAVTACETDWAPCYNVTLENYITFSGCDGNSEKSPFGNTNFPQLCNPAVEISNSCRKVNLKPLGETEICCCTTGSTCNYRDAKPTKAP